MLDLVNHTGCKTRFLLDYFGENLEGDCGHCQFCLHGENESIHRGMLQMVDCDKKTAEQVLQLRMDHPDALASKRQVTRFLCRLSSPMLVKEKLTRHELFGRMGNAPFAEVMKWVADNL